MRLEILERHEQKLQEKLWEAKLKKEKKQGKDKEKANRRRQRKEVRLQQHYNILHPSVLGLCFLSVHGDGAFYLSNIHF